MGNIHVIPTFQPGLTDHSLALFLADLRSWVFRSQARAAQHFLLDRTTIWRYEEGKTQPLPGYLAALAWLVAERFESEAPTAAPYRQQLLHEINQAILACYPDEQPFADWEDLVRSAEAFQQARQRSPAGRQGSRGKALASVAAQQPDAHIDWGDAPEIAAFYGRRHELAMLQHLLIAEQRRVLGVLGVGGVGKTILVARLVDLVKAEFDVIIWRAHTCAPLPSHALTTSLTLLVQPV